MFLNAIDICKIKTTFKQNCIELCVLTVYFIFTLLQGIPVQHPIPAQAQTSNEE